MDKEQIKDIMTWFELQIDYIPTYLEALENVDNPNEALVRVMRDNLRIYREILGI